MSLPQNGEFMTRCLIVLILLLSTAVHASEPAGKVGKWEGDVLLYEDGAVRGKTIETAETPFHVGDSIRTKRDSIAFILFNDGSRIVLKENSSLNVTGIDHANVDSGRVLFEIKKRGRAKGLEITSATVTMGVKGTRFAVDNENDHVAIFLKEGELEVSSLEDAFKRAKGGLKEDFESMQEQLRTGFESTTLQMQQEFEEAQHQMREGNIEYINEFLMTAGSAVSIEDGNLSDLAFPEDLDRDFILLDSF